MRLRFSRGFVLCLMLAVAVSMIVVSRQITSAQGAGEKIRVATLPLDTTGAAFYAYEEGFFQHAGLDAELIGGQNGAAILAAVASGSIEFGNANTAVLAAAHEHGLPFVLVAPVGIYLSKAPTAALVVGKASPVSAARDLIGKTVGIAVLKGIAEVGLKAWLDQNRVPIEAVRFVEIPVSEMGVALSAGRVDAVIIEEPQLNKLLATGGVRIVARPYDAIGPRWVQGAYICTLDYARAHPDIVKRFSEAIAAADVWANRNQPQSAKILEKYFKAPIPQAQVRITYPDRLRASDLQPLIDASAKYRIINKPFPAAEMFAPGLSAAGIWTN